MKQNIWGKDVVLNNARPRRRRRGLLKKRTTTRTHAGFKYGSPARIQARWTIGCNESVAGRINQTINDIAKSRVESTRAWATLAMDGLASTKRTTTPSKRRSHGESAKGFFVRWQRAIYEGGFNEAKTLAGEDADEDGRQR